MFETLLELVTRFFRQTRVASQSSSGRRETIGKVAHSNMLFLAQGLRLIASVGRRVVHERSPSVRNTIHLHKKNTKFCVREEMIQSAIDGVPYQPNIAKDRFKAFSGAQLMTFALEAVRARFDLMSAFDPKRTLDAH